MVNLIRSEIDIHGRVSKIARFEVWFQSPIGLSDNLDVLIEKLKEVDFEINTPGMIVPVTVAIAENEDYEVMST